ncbi:MAG TPA: spermidine/putrescine ABC transporter substrate-binding protein [Anaerolineales bacterium]
MGDRLTLLIWPDYVDPATLAAFEHETGIGVDLEIFPSAVALLDRMRDGSRPPDVLTPPSYSVLELAASGLLARLDHSRLPNLHHLEPRFLRGRVHDPESHISITKDWGTTGFMVRLDRVSELPTSWEDFWRLSEQYSGHVTVLDSPGEVIGAALKMRGRSYNASGADELADARLDLLRLKPHLLRFETNYRPLLASGEAWLSLGWNGDAAALKTEGIPVWYVIPSEGSQIWEDDWAIAAGAPNPAAAHAFLDFLLRPDIAAREARYTRYATGNRSALALLDDATRSDPSTYPPDELIRKLEAGMPLAADARQRRKALWEEVRQ